MPRSLRLHEVVVGNIGSVIISDKPGAYTKAKNLFEEYKQQSKDNYGRAAGESVTWFMDGEPYREFVGSLLLKDQE